MAEYKLKISENSIPFSENSQVRHIDWGNKAFAISNNTLYEFEFNGHREPRIEISKDDKYPLEDARLLHVEPINSEQTALIVKTIKGLRIYVHSKTRFYLAAEDDKYHDVFGWNKPDNSIQFGHFYQDTNLLGMMTTHEEYGTKFYAIFMDVLISGDFPIYPLKTNTEILKTFSPNGSFHSLTGDLQISIVSRNHEGLALFKFNKANGIDFVMKVPHCGMTQATTQTNDETLIFTDLTSQEYADIVHLNSSGMFIYQYDKGYKFLHYNPSFSQEKGWTSKHRNTMNMVDINNDGYLEMIFTGPKGIEAITYNKYVSSWNSTIKTSSIPPNKRHAELMHVIPQSEDYIDDSYVFTYHEGNRLHWAKVVSVPLEQMSNSSDSPISISRVKASTELTPLQIYTPTILKPMPLLRDMNIFSDILNCINPAIGKPKFSIPLINLPEPSLKFIINYDATSSTNDILGIGWTMPLNLIAMDDGNSVFEEDKVFVIAFQDSTHALVYEPKESTSEIFIYKLSSSNEKLKFRAKFYPKNDQWIVELGTGVKQIYGRIQGEPYMKGAVSKEIVWRNWHGPGFDSSNQLERSRLWYLAEIRDERGKGILEFYYDVDDVKVNSGLSYTRAVYLKKSRDFQGNTIEFYYKEKFPNEYRTYDPQDQEGNFNWEPTQTRFLSGYTFEAPSSQKQEIAFSYTTTNGYRFLSEILQPQDGSNSPVVTFEYTNLRGYKFALKRAVLPFDVIADFTYNPVGHVYASNELKRLDVSADYKVTTADDYILISFLNGKSPGQLVLRMFNLDMTKELYTSDSRVKAATKGRWPLLGEYGSVRSHEIIKGDLYFGVILYYAVSKLMCLFGRNEESNNWVMNSTCYEFSEQAVIKAGEDFCLVADPQSKVELFEWISANRTWNRQTIILKADKTVIWVHKNKFVTYDNRQLSLGYKEPSGTWNHKPLVTIPNCLSKTEGLLKRFDLSADYKKLILYAFRNNIVKFHRNLIALNCLNLNDHQLQSNLKLYTIDTFKNVANNYNVVVNQDDLRTFVTKEEKNTQGNYFKFRYKIDPTGKFYIKVDDFRGPMLEKLKEDGQLDQKPQIQEQLEKSINAPAKRFLLKIENYIMSFNDKVIMCNDQKLTFGGDGWKQTTLTESQRSKEKESASIPLADKFILEKANKESTIQLLAKSTRKLLSNLTVNLTDIRVFYPVYLATQARGVAVRVLEFDNVDVRERSLPLSETLSPFSNPIILITQEGLGDDTKTAIFRQQYGLRKSLPNHVVNQVTVIFDSDRRKRVTGYEYDTKTAEFKGNAVLYSKISIVPANKKDLYGWIEQSLTEGNSTAYDSNGTIVKYIPKQDDQEKNEEETDEEATFRKETTIFDESGMLEIAQCAPFRLTEELVGYYGFEDYEQNLIGSSKRWQFNKANVIRNGFALTGRNYLHQKTEQIEGIFQPRNQNAEFIASTWVRLHNVTEVPQVGEVTPYLRASVITSSNSEVVSLLSEVKFTLDNWVYLELFIDLVYARNLQPDTVTDVLQIVVRVGPTTVVPIDIDHVRFAPLISEFSVNIFDTATRSITAVIQSTGSIRRTLYDVHSTVVAKTNEQNQIEELTVYTKSGGLMKTKMPRSTIRIEPQLGFYEQFAPFAFVDRWKIIEKEPWRIAPYQLEHVANTSNILKLNTKDIDSDSYGFRVIYSLNEHSAAIIINDFIELFRNSNLCKISVYDTNMNPFPIPSVGEILLIKEHDRLLVWIDGNLYIDQTSNSPPSKPLEFSIRGKVSIRDIIVFSKPLVNVNYQNSLDEPTQEIFLESAESIIVKEKLYDELGRQRITTKKVRIMRSKFEPILGYLSNFVYNDGLEETNSVWKTGLLEGLATSVIGHPYGFTETRYDNNPLNEKTIVALPGKNFSASGNFPKRFTTKTKNLFIANRYPITMNVTYQVELKPGSIEDITVLNSNNKKIANFVHVPGGKDLFSTYKLNKDGNILQALPPLYFERVGSFHKLNSDLLTISEEDYRLQRKLGIHIEYNEKGKPIRKTTADAGPMEYVYDSNNQPRFVLYYSYNTPSTVETIVYFTYDPLGRVLASGHLLNTTIPKDQLLNVHLTEQNSVEYQSFNYANFERDPTLRGRLLRTITINKYEPFAEVMVVNDKGDSVEKRIILPPLTESEATSEPIEIVITKSYLGGRLHKILYPAKFFGEPFVLAYDYDKLGHLKSIGTPRDQKKFFQIERNAEGQIIEETYDPDSVYAFKQQRTYNEPGFLTKLQNPFQTQEISYTESSYGGANRGDGSISRVKFSANWHETAPSKATGLNPTSFVRDFMSSSESRICFEALKNLGYLDNKNQQVKVFYPDLEIGMPIICTSGATGRHISNVLGSSGFPREHGYRFDYGAHHELTKAKYFVGTDEPKPLQPDTFSKEIPGISNASSNQIWKALKEGHFLIEDPDRANLSSSHGKEGLKTFVGSNLFTDLKDINPDYAFLAGPLRKLLTSRYSQHQTNFSLPQMQDIINQWMGSSTSKSEFALRSGTDIFEMLRTKHYLQNPLDREFQNILKDFEPFFADIVRILFTYFGRQLGSSEFDVESYEIDCNGNHRAFNTGFEHYNLRYEEDSNRVDGVKLKAFDSGKPEVYFPMRHDSRGNVVQALHKGIQSMSYHPVSNLLQSVKMVDGTLVEFYYDSKGERVLKRVTNPEGKIRKEIHYLRDEQGRSLVERELDFLDPNQPPAVLITMYIYNSNGLVGFVRRDQFYSVLTDHQGSVRQIIRDGEVVSAYDYLPYGNHMRVFGIDPEAHISYRYTGQEWDSEIGLYNYHARLYDPNIGRFYQIDPKEQYFSPYKYAGNSPISMVDPDGEFAFMLAFAIVAMLAGAYLGGAAANGSFDLTQWKLSWGTVLGVFFGGLTGFFFPSSLVASVAALTAAGVPTAFAILITVTAGAAMSYLSMASANGSWNPKDWDFSSPTTWSAMFDGFAMGTSLIGGLKNVRLFYKQLSVRGKIGFFAASAIGGSGLVVMGGIATDWNLENPQFWFAMVSSVTAAPELAIFGLKGIKAISNRFKMAKGQYHYLLDAYRRRNVHSLREPLIEANRLQGNGKIMIKTFLGDAAFGVTAFFFTAALSHGFSNFNTTDMSTYQNILTSIQLGAQAKLLGRQSLIAVRKRLDLRKQRKIEALSSKIATMASEVYIEAIKETVTKTTVVDGVERSVTVKKIDPKNKLYNEHSQTNLLEEKIPNPAMTVATVGDVSVVAFSTNSAPGIYLVYDHKNLANPTYRKHVEIHNKMLGGSEIAIRDDATLAADITTAVKAVQDGILAKNKASYTADNLRSKLELAAGLDSSIDPYVSEQVVNAMETQILARGFVEGAFVLRKLTENQFENQVIRNADETIVKERQKQDEILNKIKANRDKQEAKKLQKIKNEISKEVQKLTLKRNEIYSEQREIFMKQLIQPVEHLKKALTTWEITNCAEPHVLQAIERQQKIFGEQIIPRNSRDVQLDIDYLATYKTGELPNNPIPFQRCDNCMVSTALVRNVLTDKGWMERIKEIYQNAANKAWQKGERVLYLLPMLNLYKTSKEEEERKSQPIIRSKRSVTKKSNHSFKQSTDPRPTWYTSPLQWVKSFKSLPNNSSKPKEDSYGAHNILELGDGFLSKLDVNGTLLLADVIMAKCNGRKVFQMPFKSSSQLHTAELLCNISELFESTVKEVAVLSGMSEENLNIDSFKMQQELIPLLRKHQFERIPQVLVKHALAALDSNVFENEIDTFIEIFESLNLSHSIIAVLVRMENETDSRIKSREDLAYNKRSGYGDGFSYSERISLNLSNQNFLK